LPHFTPETVKTYRKLIKEHNITNSSIDTYCRLSKADRAKLQLGLSAEQQKDIEALIKVLPVIDVSAVACTEGETEMTQSDAITLQFKLKLPNLDPREYPGYVHSQEYPFLKKQAWWILITDLNKDKTILAHKIVLRNTKNTEGRLTPANQVEKEPLNEEIFEIRQRFG
jgi:hypothetical protein